MNNALRQPSLCCGDRTDRVGDGDTLKHRIGEDGGRPSNEEAVRRRGENSNRPSLAAAPRGALQGGAGADQIVEDDRRAIAYFADQQLTGDDTAAAPLLDEGGRGLRMQFSRERAAELLGPLGAADVGRNDSDFFMPEQPGEVVDKERYRLEICRLAAESVLSKAATLWTSRVITASAPQASKSRATYFVVIGSCGCVRRSLRA